MFALSLLSRTAVIASLVALASGACSYVAPADRADCGNTQWTAATCAAAACCWDNSVAGTIWCYNPSRSGCSASPANYEVTIYTGDVRLANTGAWVYVKLTGTKGAGTETSLDTPEHDDFERNKDDTFKLTEKAALGSITSLHLRHDNSGTEPGWFVDKVVVKDVSCGGATYTFPYYEWLDKDIKLGDDFFPQTGVAGGACAASPAKYRVTVYTGDVDDASTGAKVYVQLIGSKASGTESNLYNALFGFDRNMAIAYYVSESSSLGSLTGLKVRHDNSGSGPGWYLDKIVVTDLSCGGAVYTFPYNEWLWTGTSLSANLVPK